ncbi:MAG: hypothetical protein ACUVTL_00840 [Thermoproteota archaeon]
MYGRVSSNKGRPATSLTPAASLTSVPSPITVGDEADKIVESVEGCNLRKEGGAKRPITMELGNT